MTINDDDKYQIFINSIKVNDNTGKVDWTELLERGLSKVDIELCRDKLIKDNVIKGAIEVRYAPEIPQPTFLGKPVEMSLAPNKIYNRPIYIFKVNQTKLNKLFKKQTSQADITLYTITTTDKKREIILNIFPLKKEITLSKPDFASENDDVFRYVYNHPNKKIGKDEIEFEKKIKIKKEFKQIINDLGFKGKVKDLFFPNISNKAIEFINPITKNYIEKYKISPITLTDLKDVGRNRKK